MKICIATSGRFHVLDLARELSALGHDVVFYSYVPLSRAVKFGLPKNCHVNLFPYFFPLLGLQRLAPYFLHDFFNKIIVLTLDFIVSKIICDCDVLIAMSGMYISTLKSVRNKYNSIIVIERGSRHINSQLDIVNNLNKRGFKVDKIPKFFIDRELFSYNYADLITIPSLHVESSFNDFKIDNVKLFRNPYGVDLEMFKSTPVPKELPCSIIFVGSWCYRKGVDILSDAIQILTEYNFIHVGPIGDAPLPTYKNFSHFDAVDQSRLREFYSRSDLFVLPSREEGLALVQAQALSCGLPVVCTNRTGGEDLKQILKSDKWIKIVNTDDVNDLVSGLREMALHIQELNYDRELLSESGKSSISWASYGIRYSSRIERLKYDLNCRR